MVKSNIIIVGVKNFTGADRKVNYYLIMPDGNRIYAFTRKFTQKTYEMCKGGIRVNDLLTRRSEDYSVMSLIKYLKFMMPYFKEEYFVA